MHLHFVWRARRLGFACGALGLCAVMSGCSADQTRPERPVVMADATPGAGSVLRYSLADFRLDKAAYDGSISAARDAGDAATAQRHLESARLSRDIMINRIRADIRDHSGEFEDTLRQKIAEWSTGADMVELGLAAVTTIVGGEQAKTVLAAILTAVKGGRISVDKNFFRERTSEAIIAALRASRLEQDTAIVTKMSRLDVRQYTFEEAWNDLVDLYYAGTLASGFQSLAEQAAAAAESAQQRQIEANAERVELAAAAPEEIAVMGRLYGALRDMSEEQAGAILRELGIEGESGTEGRRVLQAELRRLTPGDPRTAEFGRIFDRVLGQGGW